MTSKDRLPWQRSTSGDWFVAYPDGHPDHAATIRHMPRDVQGEIGGMLLDRIDREPAPAGLLSEDSDYLRRVLAEIERRWRDL